MQDSCAICLKLRRDSLPTSVQCSMENINNFVCRKLQLSEGCETHMGNGVIQPCVMIIFTLRFEDNTVITLAVVRPDSQVDTIKINRNSGWSIS